MSDERNLGVSGVYKAFAGVQALADVSFELRAGEVHALLGENGAGKSTLLKILSGAERPDSGTVVMNGAKLALKNPASAFERGIATIYQEFSLVPWLSVSQNLYLGRETVAGGVLVSRSKMRDLAGKELARLGLEIDPSLPVARLGVAERQLVEITRALSRNASFILMDEPTASLTEREIARLFDLVAELRRSGVGILYISHRLEEIAKIADRVTVMRDGRVVHSDDAARVSFSDMIALMVGRPISNHYPKRQVERGGVLFEVSPAGGGRPSLPFRACAGEVVGIAGLMGSGRTEWARGAFGADPENRPIVKIGGVEVAVTSPNRSRGNGIGMVPENRKDQGLVLGRSVRENITITILERLRNALGLVGGKRKARASRGFVEALRIKCADDKASVDTLSGGNQQKVVLAKWLACEGRIIILDEPTRGIDVGSKLEMYNLMNGLCEAGKTVVLISSDLPELLSMSDRIYVMYRGRLVRELDAKSTTQEEVLRIASFGEDEKRERAGETI